MKFKTPAIHAGRELDTATDAQSVNLADVDDLIEDRERGLRNTNL